MISHKYKCIFVHIPRCAGTSLEKWLIGKDWWSVEPQTKHLLASQARRLYEKHWDEYFKFALVRAPVDRTISMLKFANYFGLEAGPNRISFDGYHEKFGHDIILENDYRFSKRSDVLRALHQAGSIYGNLLDEELDFIGKYEDLKDVTTMLADRLRIPTKFVQHEEKSPGRRDVAADLSSATLNEIHRMYEKDYVQFNYG